MIDRDDAIIIINILLTADGGCSYCARELCFKFMDCFGYDDDVEELFMRKFGQSLRVNIQHA